LVFYSRDMRILIVGYGKLGKAFEQIALKRNHSVPFKITSSNKHELAVITKADVDVAIEFSNPESAFENVKTCIEKGIPVVCGTTGWLDRQPEIEKLCHMYQGGFFYASNYSLSVNLFFHLNNVLARVMSNYPAYNVSLEETHHAEKRDAPSGTAITLAEGVIENISSKKKWVNDVTGDPSCLGIVSKRIENVPGTHSVSYASATDTIAIKHTALTRQRFAEGAIVAAEWLVGKTGVFGMGDMLRLNV
jgi:4-hydroxy-tetrahydrodipicolinate reductase